MLRGLLFLCRHIVPDLVGQMVQKLEAWADELGDKFQLTVFGKRVVVVAGNAGVRHVLNMRPRIYRRGLTPVSSCNGAIQCCIIAAVL